jgi:hypothetical protein
LEAEKRERKEGGEKERGRNKGEEERAIMSMRT